jgi:hypothetical protein
MFFFTTLPSSAIAQGGGPAGMRKTYAARRCFGSDLEGFEGAQRAFLSPWCAIGHRFSLSSWQLASRVHGLSGGHREMIAFASSAVLTSEHVLVAPKSKSSCAKRCPDRTMSPARFSTVTRCLVLRVLGRVLGFKVVAQSSS